MQSSHGHSWSAARLQNPRQSPQNPPQDRPHPPALFPCSSLDHSGGLCLRKTPLMLPRLLTRAPWLLGLWVYPHVLSQPVSLLLQTAPNHLYSPPRSLALTPQAQDPLTLLHKLFCLHCAEDPEFRILPRDPAHCQTQKVAGPQNQPLCAEPVPQGPWCRPQDRLQLPGPWFHPHRSLCPLPSETLAPWLLDPLLQRPPLLLRHLQLNPEALFFQRPLVLAPLSPDSLGHHGNYDSP